MPMPVAVWSSLALAQAPPARDREHAGAPWSLVGGSDRDAAFQDWGRVTSEEAQAFVARSLRTVGKNGQTPVWLGPSDWVLSTAGEAP